MPDRHTERQASLQTHTDRQQQSRDRFTHTKLYMGFSAQDTIHNELNLIRQHKQVHYVTDGQPGNSSLYTG